MFSWLYENYFAHLMGFTHVLTDILYCIAISLTFNKLPGKDYKQWLRLAADCVVVWVVNMLALAFLNWLDSTGATAIGSMIMYVSYPLICALHLLYPWKKKFMVSLVYAGFASIFLVVGLSLSSSLGIVLVKLTNVNDFFNFSSILVSLFVIGLVIVFKVLDFSKFKYVRNSFLIFIFGVLVCSFVLMILFRLYGDNTNNGLCIGYYCLLLVIDVVVYLLTYYIVREYNQKIDFQALAMKEESLENQIHLSEVRSDELHQIRHDLKNHFAYAEKLLQDKDYENLETYFADLSEQVHVAVDFFDCGNPCLNELLNLGISKAKSNGLTLTCKVACAKDLPIEKIDLNSLLFNIVDNAIEGVLRDQVEEKTILLEIFQEKNYLIISCKNAVSESRPDQVFTSLRSSKENRNYHGYGTKVIRRIAEKYHGVSKFQIKDHYFITEVMLDVSDKKEN